MYYDDIAIGYLGFMGVVGATAIMLIGARNPRSPVIFLPLAGFIGAVVMWAFMAPKVGLVHLVGLTTLSGTVTVCLAVAAILAYNTLRSRRVAYRRPGGLP